MARLPKRYTKVLAYLASILTVVIMTYRVTFLSYGPDLYNGYRLRSLKSNNFEFDSETNLFPSHLVKYADKQRTLLLAYVEFGYIDMALNLYVTSLAKHKINNYLYISTDQKSCDVLRAKDIHCFSILHNISGGGSPSNYGTESFNIKSHFKVKLVLDALKKNITIILIDLDIVFFKNPVPILVQKANANDLVIQQNGGNGTRNAVNTGFYLVRPTPASINLFKETWRIGNSPTGKNENDQDVIADLLVELMTNKKIKVVYLDFKGFPTGLLYWESDKRMFQYKDPLVNSTTILVHNNWVVSKAAKIYRFKESQLWKYDYFKYYSNDSTKYLVYHNPYHGDKKGLLKLEKDALVSALSIGYILNRKVILPAFHCYGCASNACATKDQECSLMAHFEISQFDKYFADQYREHVFLNNSMTSTKVKQSISEMILISSAFIQNAIFNKSVTASGVRKTFHPKKGKDGASVSEIQTWFGNRQESVLHFHSLYNAFEGFPNTAEYSKVKSNLLKAFKNTTYRQM